MKGSLKVFLTLVSVFFLIGGKSLFADGVPQFINVQGILYDNDGNPVNGIYDITISLYSTDTGGTPIAQKVVHDASVENGLFHVTMEITGNPFKTYPAVWIGIKIDTDPEMTPRQKIVAVPYAFEALHADEATKAYDLQCTNPLGCVSDDELEKTYAYGDANHNALSAVGLNCDGCVNTTDIGDAQVTSAKVNFNYAGSSSKGGPALDVACDSSPCINSNEVSFNYAASQSKGGPASDVQCADPNGCIGTLDIENSSVTPAKVSFNYAASTSKGGPASDLECPGCVGASDVGFNYAASSSKGGPAIDVACPGCVEASDIKDGTITSAKVNFNYAASTSKGGPASNLECVGGACVSSSEVDFNYAGSSSKGGPALDVACSSCIDDNELVKTYAYGDSSHRAIDLECQTPGCVSSSDIQDGGVTLSDLAANSVDSSKIVNGSIQPEDLGFSVWAADTDLHIKEGKKLIFDDTDNDGGYFEEVTAQNDDQFEIRLWLFDNGDASERFSIWHGKGSCSGCAPDYKAHEFRADGYVYHDGIMTVNGSHIDARKIVDLDNTAYYLDPASFSKLGKVELQASASYNSPVLNIINSADTWYNIQFKRSGDMANDYFIGRSPSSYYNGRTLALHVPSKAASYGNSGIQPKIAFVSSGAKTLGYVEADTGRWYFMGNVGIGTESPQGKFTANIGSWGTVNIGGTYPDLWFTGGSDSVFWISNRGASTGRTSITYGNTELFTVKNNGNVGVGTTNPQEKFHVSGAIRADGVIYSYSDPSYLPPAQLKTWGIDKADKHLYIEWGNSSDDYLYITDHWKYESPMYVQTGPIHFMAGNKYGIYVGTNGRVGIGTDAPQSKLHIVGGASGSLANSTHGIFIDEDSSGHPRIELRGSGKYPYIDFSNDLAKDYTARIIYNESGTGALEIKGSNVYFSNSVGIGKLSPAYKLDVNGGVNATKFCINGSCVTSWTQGNIGGGGSKNYIAKWTGGSTLGNSQIYDNGTNVGIGTTSPNFKLRVEGDIYLTNWLRFHDNDGIYWGNTGWHIYPVNSNDLYIRGGACNSSLRFTCSGTSTKGYLHWTTEPAVGFLDAGRGWLWRSKSYSGYAGNIWFETGDWSGNPGNNWGKLEYHSNRFYLVSGSNSDEILRFRRGDSDKGIIYNDGSAYFFGYVKAKSDLKTNSGNVYFGETQHLTGDKSAYLKSYSNHSTVTGMIFFDKEGTKYGYVYGSGNGSNFGLLDGDGNWSYLAIKDSETRFYINNSNKMSIYSNGNVKLHQGWLIAHPNHGIYFPENAWGGSGDVAYIQYFSEGGENTKLRILNQNDANDDIEFYQYGAWRLKIESGEISTNGKFCAKKEFKTNNADIWSDNWCDCSWSDIREDYNTADVYAHCPKGKFVTGVHFGQDNDPDTNERFIQLRCCRPCEFSTH